jgi:hypothetical protein
MRMKDFQARKSTRSRENCSRACARYRDDIGVAIIKILRLRLEILLRLRLEILRSRFGRDLDADDPLFSSPRMTKPLIAGETEIKSQVIPAAEATRTDPVFIMRFLGLD